MGVGANRLHLAAHGDEAVGRADELFAQPFLHRLYAPILPEERVPAAGTEISDAQVGHFAKRFDLLPELGHGAGVEDLKLELAHVFENGTAAQFHEHGKRGDLPQHDLWPGAFERQLILTVALFEVVRRQAKTLKPLHEIGAKHLAFAVERVAAQPCAFPARE